MYEPCEDCGKRTIKGNHVCTDCLIKRSKRSSPWDELVTACREAVLEVRKQEGR